MKNCLFAALVAVCTMSVSEPLMAQRGGGGGSRSKPLYDRLLSAFDANRDGVLAAIECPAMLWNRISVADTNLDGYVTRAEYDGYRPSFFIAPFGLEASGILEFTLGSV